MSGEAEASMVWHERVAQLRAAAPYVDRPSYAHRLAALASLAERLQSDRPGELAQVPGLAFLAGFLGTANLRDLIAREVPNPDSLDRFVPAGGRKSLRLMPRGVVCHWIAGNVPLLGMFSWAVSALAGNINLIRLSSRQRDFVSPLMQMLELTGPAGADLAAHTLVVHFDRDDVESHRRMSDLADVRIAWGSEDAVEAIAAYPARWDADTIVFGPRVSLAAIDTALVTEGALRRLVTDIIYFDQLACSSPQRVFVKVGQAQDVVAFIDRFVAAVERECSLLRRLPLGFADTYRIELDRARVLLDGGHLRTGTGTSWTVAVDERPVTRLTCMNRFIEVIPFRDVAELLGWIPAQVQTVVTLLDGDDLQRFTESAARYGVCRFPRPGEGNGFESPWDGTPLVARLTRWVVRTDSRPQKGEV